MRKSVKHLLICIALTFLMGMSAIPVLARKSVTPSNGYRYLSPSATYVIDKQPKFYRSVWESAISAWKKAGFDWQQSGRSKTHLRAVTMKQHNKKHRKRFRLTKNTAGMCIYAHTADSSRLMVSAEVVLNKDAIRLHHLTKKQCINVAEHELGHALGLTHNKSKKSVMYYYNQGYSIQKADIAGMRKIYSGAVAEASSIGKGSKKHKIVKDAEYFRISKKGLVVTR